MPESSKAPPVGNYSESANVVMATLAVPERTAPPISILHLIVFTTGFAIYLGIENLFDHFFQRKEKDAFHWVTLMLNCAAFGIIVACPWLLFQVKKTSGKVLVHGGHWLLLFAVFAVLLGLFDRLLFQWMVLADSIVNQESIAVYYFVSASQALFGLVIAILFAVFDPEIYRWIFIAMAAQYAIHAAFSVVVGLDFLRIFAVGINGNIDYGVFAVVTAIKVVSLLAITMIDFFSGKRRDWIHWAGVIAFGIYSVLVQLMWFIYGFFQ